MTRIEIRPRPGFPDGLARRASLLLGFPPRAVSGARVYYVEPLPEDHARELALTYLADPVADDVAIGDPPGEWAIEVAMRPGVTDNEGNVASEILSEALGRPVHVRYARRFDVRREELNGFDGAQLESHCGARLANPVVERFRILARDNAPLAGSDDPREYDGLAADVLAAGLPLAIDALAGGLPLAGGVQLPADALPPGVELVALLADDSALAQLSSERMLALSVAELRAVRDYLADPAVSAERTAFGLPVGLLTDAELEAIAQTWSEHCKHKVFNDRVVFRHGDRTEVIEDGLFKTFICAATQVVAQERDFLVSVFADNAGVVRFDADHHLVFKVETHNSPSALEPYGGALTGIVGVNRDPAGTGLGCRLLFNTDVFCVAPPSWRHPLPAGVLHPGRVLSGIRKGVEDGGNQSGVPTVNGGVCFDDRYLGRPLVFCGTGGLMDREVAGQLAHQKQILAGDLIVMVGGRVGRDGIHGATFSSAGVEARTPVGVVQIGDPITQKRALDMLAEARSQGLYRAITDNGAGGLSSSVGELALLSGGCEIHLDQVPLKAPGLLPWEILVSESQERMTLAVAPDQWPELSALAVRRGVEATAVGRFTDSGRYVATHAGRPVALLDLRWLHETGLPRRTLEAEWDTAPGQAHPSPVLPIPSPEADRTATLLKLLGALNICSREGLVRQYDHEVQGGSVVKPLVGIRRDGPSDAAVIRPLLESQRAVAVSNGLGCRHGDLDPYQMAINAVDEAIRNAVCVGADPDHLAILDNFCWPDPVFDPQRNPDGRRKLGALVRACQGLYEAAVAFGAPLISGKDSVKNDFTGKWPPSEVGADARDLLGVAPAPLGPGAAPDDLKLSAPPTLLVSAIAVVPEATWAVTMDFKAPGDLVYVVGQTRAELGASEYERLDGAARSGAVPTVDLAVARRCYQAVHLAMRQELVASCHDASEGGLAVALAESALAGELGVSCDLALAPGAGDLACDAVLFSESAGRLLLSIAPADRERFEEHFDGLPLACVGQVSGAELPDAAAATLQVAVRGRMALHAAVKHLKQAWQETPQW